MGGRLRKVLGYITASFYRNYHHFKARAKVYEIIPRIILTFLKVLFLTRCTHLNRIFTLKWNKTFSTSALILSQNKILRNKFLTRARVGCWVE